MSLLTDGSGDMNEGFRPRHRSKLEETRLDETDHHQNQNSTANSNYKRAERSLKQCFYKPPRDILNDCTAPFPVHEENLKPVNREYINNNNNSYSKNILILIIN